MKTHQISDHVLGVAGHEFHLITDVRLPLGSLVVATETEAVAYVPGYGLLGPARLGGEE